MGNAMKSRLSCRALSLSAVLAPTERGAKIVISRPAPKKEEQNEKEKEEEEKPAAFRIEDVSQLDLLVEEIDQALSNIQKKKAREKKSSKFVQNYVGDAGNVLSILGQNCQNSNMQLDCSRLATVVGDMLAGAKNLHWAGAALGMVAYVLRQVDQVYKNTAECSSLLIAMSTLAKHIRALIPHLPEHDDKLQEATIMIASGAALCCACMRRGRLIKFAFAGVTKDDLDQLRKDLDRLYPDLHLAAEEVQLDRTKILLRQGSLPLSPLTPLYPTNKVGLDERVDGVMQKLMLQDPSTRAVVLHGMGGIGKSTLGDGVYARLNYPGRTHCKIEVGENPSSTKICDLQANIYERLSGEKHRLGDTSEGRQKLAHYFRTECRDPLFIYIDNVLNARVLNDLLPENLVLPPKSRLLVTSRMSTVCAVLQEMGIETDLHEVAELDFPEAQKLLCMQVFDKQHPPPHKQTDVTNVLRVCGGLPLALEVVGKYLRLRNCDTAWLYAIDSLQQWNALTGTKEDRLYHTLEFSYEQLTASQKKAFLDIAAYYLDLAWEMVKYVIGEDRLVALEGLALVKKKRPVDSDDVDRVHVHDLWAALGRNKEGGVRIWSTKESELPPVLMDEDAGRRKVEGFCLRNCGEVLPAKSLDMLCSSLRILILEQRVEGQCQKLPTQLQLFITKGSMPFQRLQKLTQLAFLNLSEVDMDFRNIEFPRNLKALEINDCKTLRELPNGFGQLRFLQKLDLSLCENLERFPAGFGQLGALQSLELRWCKRLKELPGDFVQLTALQRLDLGGCRKLAVLPVGFGQLSMLQQLMLWHCGRLAALPDDFGQLAALQELNLCGCRMLTKLPEHFGRLSNLHTLSLAGCSRLSQLSDDFGCLSSLAMLKLSNCKSLEVVPESFKQLTALRMLDVAGLYEELKQSIGVLVSCDITYHSTGIEMLPSSDVSEDSSDADDEDFKYFSFLSN